MDIQQFQNTAPIAAAFLCVVALLTLIGALRSFRRARRDPTWRYRRDARERGGRLFILGLFMLFMGGLVFASVAVLGWVVERNATPTAIAFVDPLTLTDLPTAFPGPPAATAAPPSPTAITPPTVRTPDGPPPPPTMAPTRPAPDGPTGSAPALPATDRPGATITTTATAITPASRDASQTPLFGPTATGPVVASVRGTETRASAANPPTAVTNAPAPSVALSTTIAALPTRPPIQLPTNSGAGPSATPALLETIVLRVTAISIPFTATPSRSASTPTAAPTLTATLNPTATSAPATPTATMPPAPTVTASPALRFATALQSSVTPPADAVIAITALDRDLSASYGPVNPATVFPAGLTRIYFFVAYRNMQTGMVWRGALLRDGAVINRFERFWGSSVSGTAYFFFALEDGYPVGDYEIRLYFGLNPDPAASIRFKMVAVRS